MLDLVLKALVGRLRPVVAQLFAALWLTATTMLIKPNAGGRDRGAAIPRHSTDRDFTNAALH